MATDGHPRGLIPNYRTNRTLEPRSDRSTALAVSASVSPRGGLRGTHLNSNKSRDPRGVDAILHDAFPLLESHFRTVVEFQGNLARADGRTPANVPLMTRCQFALDCSALAQNPGQNPCTV